MSEGFFASLRSIASSVTQKLETAQTQYEYNMDIADQTNKSQHIIDQMQHRQQTLQDNISNTSEQVKRNTQTMDQLLPMTQSLLDKLRTDVNNTVTHLSLYGYIPPSLPQKPHNVDNGSCTTTEDPLKCETTDDLDRDSMVAILNKFSDYNNIAVKATDHKNESESAAHNPFEDSPACVMTPGVLGKFVPPNTPLQRQVLLSESFAERTELLPSQFRNASKKDWEIDIEDGLEENKENELLPLPILKTPSLRRILTRTDDETSGSDSSDILLPVLCTPALRNALGNKNSNIDVHDTSELQHDLNDSREELQFPVFKSKALQHHNTSVHCKVADAADTYCDDDDELVPPTLKSEAFQHLNILLHSKLDAPQQSECLTKQDVNQDVVPKDSCMQFDESHVIESDEHHPTVKLLNTVNEGDYEKLPKYIRSTLTVTTINEVIGKMNRKITDSKQDASTIHFTEDEMCQIVDGVRVKFMILTLIRLNIVVESSDVYVPVWE